VESTLATLREQTQIFAEKMVEAGAETGDAPDSSQVSLAKVRSLMNDGCAAAVAGARELAVRVSEQRRILGLGERPVFTWRCNNHRRVLTMAEYQKREAALDSEHLDVAELRESENANFRLKDVSLASFLRSLGKVAVGKGKKDTYAKGENAELFAWAEQFEPASGKAFADMDRGDLGSRFDWVARAAFRAYYNLEIFILPYLNIHRANTASILRDTVFTVTQGAST